MSDHDSTAETKPAATAMLYTPGEGAVPSPGKPVIPRYTDVLRAQVSRPGSTEPTLDH